MKKIIVLMVLCTLCFNVFSMNLYANEETKFNDDLQKIYEVMDVDDFVDVWIENKVNVDVKDIVNKRLNEEFAFHHFAGRSADREENEQSAQHHQRQKRKDRPAGQHRILKGVVHEELHQQHKRAQRHRSTAEDIQRALRHVPHQRDHRGHDQPDAAGHRKCKAHKPISAGGDIDIQQEQP